MLRRKFYGEGLIRGLKELRGLRRVTRTKETKKSKWNKMGRKLIRIRPY